jgi:hypothetical protein
MSRRRRALGVEARARPPFNPSSRPSAIARGFFIELHGARSAFDDAEGHAEAEKTD